MLVPGDLVAGPATDPIEAVEAGASVDVSIDGIGTLSFLIAE
jgi:hypothetical protein